MTDIELAIHWLKYGAMDKTIYRNAILYNENLIPLILTRPTHKKLRGYVLIFNGKAGYNNDWYNDSLVITLFYDKTQPKFAQLAALLQVKFPQLYKDWRRCNQVAIADNNV